MAYRDLLDCKAVIWRETTADDGLNTPRRQPPIQIGTALCALSQATQAVTSDGVRQEKQDEARLYLLASAQVMAGDILEVTRKGQPVGRFRLGLVYIPRGRHLEADAREVSRGEL